MESKADWLAKAVAKALAFGGVCMVLVAFIIALAIIVKELFMALIYG